MNGKRDAMEYSFCLVSSNPSLGVREATNPFTREVIRVPVDGRLSAQQLADLGAVIDKHAFIGPQPDGEGYVYLHPDGSNLRLRGWELEPENPVTTLQVEITATELSDDLLQVVLDLAKASELVLTSPAGNCARTLGSTNAELSDRYPDLKSISTTDELRYWITDELPNW